MLANLHEGDCCGCGLDHASQALSAPAVYLVDFAVILLYLSYNLLAQKVVLSMNIVFTQAGDTNNLSHV